MDGELMSFVQRLRGLQAHRDSQEDLIKVSCWRDSLKMQSSPHCLRGANAKLLLQDLILYAENIESTLRSENAQLSQKLNDAQLDLNDSIQSRRELQQRIQQIQARADYAAQDNEMLKVFQRCYKGPGASELK